MAKTISISQAEYDYLLEIVASDGLTIAKLEEENRLLKKQLAKGGENHAENQLTGQGSTI